MSEEKLPDNVIPLRPRGEPSGGVEQVRMHIRLEPDGVSLILPDGRETYLPLEMAEMLGTKLIQCTGIVLGRKPGV